MSRKISQHNQTITCAWLRKEVKTWVIILGSMNRGNRSTANRESDVNALAGVRSPPSKVNNPNEITVTTTGMLFSKNPLHWKTRERVREKQKPENGWSHDFGYAHKTENMILMIHITPCKVPTSVINCSFWWHANN